MAKKIFLTLSIIAFLASCGTRRSAAVVLDESLTTDVGVVIDGVRWSTRNLGASGAFTLVPEQLGATFQWNRRHVKPRYSALMGFRRDVSWWIRGTEWYVANNPCPSGWRVPTYEELTALSRTRSEWVNQNGVYGRLFGFAPNQIFLPTRAVWTSAYMGDGHWGPSHFEGYRAVYWSSTPGRRGFSWRLLISENNTGFNDFFRTMGMHVRCVAE